MYRSCIKTALDFVAALTLALLFAPLMLFTALLVKLSSRGPVLFRQSRAGKDGRYFNILKFRTMKLAPENDGKDFHPGSASRITPVGKILRRTKIDELPQLFNVLAGDMSLVGPRPEVRTFVELYPERWQKILSVKPGITDPASVKFRNEEELLAKAAEPENYYRKTLLPKKLDIYEQYINNISLARDIKVMANTAIAVIRGR
ncbi:MAG: sugar transferase [Victivallales bacterium]|nr:sugar transferase [Victivallales bacterium]